MCVPGSCFIAKTSHIKKASDLAENAEISTADSDSPGSEQIRSAHSDRDRSRHKLIKNRERQDINVNSAEESNLLENARVIATEGAYFVLKAENGSEIRAKTYKGTRASNPNSTLVAVGDEVRVSLKDSEHTMIEEVLPRRTKLSRRASGTGVAFEQVIVSNIDMLVIVASVGEPKLRSGIIDRYIVAGIEGGLSIAIAINKIDLASSEEMDEALYFRDLYEEIGYRVLLVSAELGTGIDELRKVIEGKTSVFAGHSGVGKSSIMNAVFGREVGKTGTLQKKFRRGAHTTASTTLLAVDNMPGTYIADTPGVREFSNFELDTHNLKFAYIEFLPFAQNCAMHNCSHIHEPGCAVRKAVEDDKISIDRYTSYEKLFAEAKTEETKRTNNK